MPPATTASVLTASSSSAISSGADGVPVTSPAGGAASSSSAAAAGGSSSVPNASGINGNGSSTAPGGGGAPAAGISSSSSDKFPDAIWDMNASVLRQWIQQTAPLDPDPTVAASMWTTLEKSLESLYEEERPLHPEDVENRDDTVNDKDQQRKKKRRKIPTIRVMHDPYHIWLHAWKDHEKSLTAEEKEQYNANQHNSNNPAENYGAGTSAEVAAAAAASADTLVLSPEADDIPLTPGGKLAHLTLGGVINALASKLGGAVQRVTPQASTHPPHYTAAMRIYRACQTRVHADILRTTPIRIQDMLAPDLTAQELAAIRKRIYDTVILGKGMHTNDPNDEDDLVVAVAPTAASGGAGAGGQTDAFQKCQICGNNDQASFVLDRKNGDVICSNCGTVVSESIMHEGSQFRKFEGEVDRNHHGDAPNHLYSNAHNMSTTLGGAVMTMTRNQGIGRGGRSNLETILRNAHAYTELNVSQFGRTDRRTRVGYKDRQKKEAFVQMTHVGDALSLHEAVVQRAKELFAGFRDDRELVQQFKGVIAACLCEAFEQLSQEGKAILKQTEQQAAEEAAALAAAKGASAGGDAKGGAPNTPAKAISARAARRNELHNATLAGKGGLLLDYSELGKDLTGKGAVNGTPGPTGTTASSANSPKASEKPAAKWDLLDCRSWLLDASRRIAQQWVEERDKATNPVAAKQIPTGSVDELEGKLVEHSIALCEHLEQELQAVNSRAGGAAVAAAPAASNGKKRIVTPRVHDMAKLGIKWQHSHERGSGGKGGIGGNAQTRGGLAAATKAAGSGGGARGGGGGGVGRTAGQILLLKTSKKLGAVLNDPVAGEAFHKELHEVIAQQETRKKQLLREEASRQRLLQMKRKPWLQARLNS